jgi:hypothetical protein
MRMTASEDDGRCQAGAVSNGGQKSASSGDRLHTLVAGSHACSSPLLSPCCSLPPSYDPLSLLPPVCSSIVVAVVFCFRTLLVFLPRNPLSPHASLDRPLPAS